MRDRPFLVYLGVLYLMAGVVGLDVTAGILNLQAHNDTLAATCFGFATFLALIALKYERPPA